MLLKTPLVKMNRVGETTARRLSALGLKTVLDLLYWFPFRYEDFSIIKKVAEIVEGENTTIKVKVELIQNRRSPRQRRVFTEAVVADDSASLRVIWFGQPFIIKNLSVGQEIYLSGRVKTDRFGRHMVSPAYERANQPTTTHTARLVPIYPLTHGLTQKQLRFLTAQAVTLTREVPDWQSPEILAEYDLVGLSDALRGIHFPVDACDLRQSSERLKFDELFILQLRAELARQEKKENTAPAIIFQEVAIKKFVADLPFTLTNAQRVAAWDILKDISAPVAMNRLVSGDVGSGKTVVAVIALLNAALNDFQAVLMAPTEILARQHYATVSRLLKDAGVGIGLFTRTQKELNYLSGEKITKKKILAEISAGGPKIIIGTHALIAERTEFKNLGLVVVDEQHRFGVVQRKTIKEKGERAHFLSMTATPIPRSLALMLYGDLAVSQIREMPHGRKKIITRLVEPKNRDKAYDFIRTQVRSGRQVFVICPLITERTKDIEEEENFIPPLFTPAGEKKSVLAEYEKLSRKIFPDLRVGYLHGKMPGAEKEKIMRDFQERKIDILVATSVVEVGVDIPNATIMMIEDAEGFGLAQLHQFRGRVGRGEHQSYCFIFTGSVSRSAQERLKFFEKESDGFRLAEKDLALRGPGEVYGTEQSGMMNLRLARLTDAELMKKARAAAQGVAKNLNKHPLIKKRLARWEERVHLE